MSTPTTSIIRYGPYGNLKDGDPWDDGDFKGIKEIELHYQKTIHSIRVLYVSLDGKVVQGPQHGVPAPGDESAKVTLDSDSGEYLSSVTGTYPSNDLPNIYSIKFQSNKKPFGPFGTAADTPFTFPVGVQGKTVGFRGRSGTILNAIGGSVETNT